MIRDLIERCKRYTPLDLAEKAKVKEGTEIKVVEYDLAPRGLIFKARDWQIVLDQWLKKGAKIDLFIQAGYKNDLRRIVDLMKKHPRLDTYDISGNMFVYSEEKNMVDDLIERFREFHFTLFKNPKQLWIERIHQPGKGYMRDCEYQRRDGTGFSRQSLRNTPEWEKQFEKYEKWVEIMKRDAKHLKIVR